MLTYFDFCFGPSVKIQQEQIGIFWQLKQLTFRPCLKILVFGQLSAVEISYPVYKISNMGGCRQLKQLTFLPYVKNFIVRQLSAVEAVDILYPVSKFKQLDSCQQLKQLKNSTVSSMYDRSQQLKQLTFRPNVKNFTVWQLKQLTFYTICQI